MREIGVGANQFDAEDFDADFATQLMVGHQGELQYETFSAAGAELHSKGAMFTLVLPRVRWSTLFS